MLITKNLELQTIRHRSKSEFYRQTSFLDFPSTLFGATPKVHHVIPDATEHFEFSNYQDNTASKFTP